LSDSERRKLQRELILSGGSQLARILPAVLVDDVLRYLAEFLIARPAVVHLWQDYTNVAAGVAAVFADVPCIVLSQRSLAPTRFQYAQSFLRPLYRFLADQPRVVLTNNSRAGAIDYARWLGIDPARIRVVYNGVDDNLERASSEAMAAWLRRHGMSGGTPVVGGVLRLSEEKNPLLWLEAVSLVAKQHPRLLAILVGSGAMRQGVIDHAQTLGLAGRLHLLESEPDVSLAISAMDVLLLTSRVEGTPNVLLEAGLLGCPVVTTAVGGCAEAVDDGVTGWVVEGATPNALAERVLAVLDDQAWRHRAAKEAPRFVRERFGNARMLSEVIHCYHSARDPSRLRSQTIGRAASV
ncbi:MAG TPA: glycosyltransferase, partial [Rhodocyclaceae bacterium]|nr:glycosyltransferase [Rhodocyclaceae bacterium]